MRRARPRMRPPARYRDPTNGPSPQAPPCPRGPFASYQETVLLNASVGVQRALDRLRPDPGPRSSKAQLIHRHSLALARGVRGLVLPDRPRERPTSRPDRRSRPSPRRRRIDSRRPRSRATGTRPAAKAAAGPARRAALAPRSASADNARVVAPGGLARRSLVSRVGAGARGSRRGRRDPARRHRDQQRAGPRPARPRRAARPATARKPGSPRAARQSAVGGPDGTIDDSAVVGLGVIANDADPWEEIEDRSRRPDERGRRRARRRHAAEAGRGRHDRRGRQGPHADLPGPLRRHAHRHRPQVRRLDDDRVVGEPPPVTRTTSTSARRSRSRRSAASSSRSRSSDTLETPGRQVPRRSRPRSSRRTSSTTRTSSSARR